MNINPNRISLRVCKDLDWKVTAWCPGCRHGYVLDLDRKPIEPIPATPIVQLLEAGVIVCRTRCDGVPADFLTVSWLDVGRSHDVARIRVDEINGRRVARLEEPPA